MPDQTAAAHGACRSGGVFPQYSSLWSGVLPHVSENPDGAATRKYFPASRFRRSVMQWGYLNRRMNRFFLARPVFSLMLGAPDRPHDAMTGPGLISLFCFLITAAYFLRGGMCAGIVLCMGLAFFHFPVAAGFAGASRFCCRFPCFSGGRKPGVWLGCG